MDVAQIALLMGGWMAAFMLGKELQGGLAQWRRARQARQQSRACQQSRATFE